MLLPLLVQPWAYESRENLRALLVGKEVSFIATYQLPPSTTDPGVQRDLGNVEFNGVDLATDLLRTGWAKVKEGKKGELGEEDLRKKDLEAEAKSAGRGIWKAEGPTVSTFPRLTILRCIYNHAWLQPYTVNYTMPVDSQGFLREHKDNTIEGTRAHYGTLEQFLSAPFRNCRTGPGWFNPSNPPSAAEQCTSDGKYINGRYSMRQSRF